MCGGKATRIQALTHPLTSAEPRLGAAAALKPGYRKDAVKCALLALDMFARSDYLIADADFSHSRAEFGPAVGLRRHRHQPFILEQMQELRGHLEVTAPALSNWKPLSFLFSHL